MGSIAAVTYKVIKPATPTVDWSALWHIIVVSVAAGCGLALLFGAILLGWELIADSKKESGKIGGYLLGAAAAAGCVAIIALGIYVMCNPPKTKPLKVETTALVTAAHRSVA